MKDTISVNVLNVEEHINLKYNNIKEDSKKSILHTFFWFK